MGGAAFGVAAAYLPGLALGGGVLLGVQGALSAVQNAEVEGPNTCNGFQAVTSMLMVSLSAGGLATTSSNSNGTTLNPSTEPNGALGIQAPVANSLSANSGQNEVMLSLNRGVGEASRIPTELFLQGRRAYWYPEWQQVGLSIVNASDPTKFEIAFPQAMNKASRINFDITKLDITRAWREGQNGIQYYYARFPNGNVRVTIDNVTNYEFYQIMTHPEWLGKTTFYRWEGNIVKWFTVNQEGYLEPKYNP